jgi:hypothetical protein
MYFGVHLGSTLPAGMGKKIKAAVLTAGVVGKNSIFNR